MMLKKSSLVFFFLSVVYGQPPTNADESKYQCPCEIETRPGNTFEKISCLVLSGLDLERCVKEKVATARWMVHSLSWGTLSTLNSTADNSGKGVPFGNIYSFVDGSCDVSTGVPYFYGTDMDPSFIQAKTNPTVSFSLSEASLASVCTSGKYDGTPLRACGISSKGGGDPENPPCARLTLVGKFSVVQADTEEHASAKAALFLRHPSMSSWPAEHGWIIAKIDIQEVWSIDFYGNSNTLTPEQYFCGSGEETGGEEL